MIIMKAEATEEEITNVVKEIKKCGLKADVSRGEYRTVIGLVGDERKIPFSHFAVLPGVKEAMMVETPYKLISKEYGKRFYEESECRIIKLGIRVIKIKIPLSETERAWKSPYSAMGPRMIPSTRGMGE